MLRCLLWHVRRHATVTCLELWVGTVGNITLTKTVHGATLFGQGET